MEFLYRRRELALSRTVARVGNGAVDNAPFTSLDQAFTYVDSYTGANDVRYVQMPEKADQEDTSGSTNSLTLESMATPDLNPVAAALSAAL